MDCISDQESLALANISTELSKAYLPDANDPWNGSPFQWIKSLPSRTVGAVGEKLVAKWAESKGFLVEKTGDSEADRLIHGHRIEIKLSTLWASGGYKFQQIRNQNYEHCFCIGLSPFEVHAWLIPKSVLEKYVIGHMGQHTGADGADTAWLGFEVGKEYDWMKPYGSSLEQVATLIAEMGKGHHTAKK